MIEFKPDKSRHGQRLSTLLRESYMLSKDVKLVEHLIENGYEEAASRIGELLQKIAELETRIKDE